MSILGKAVRKILPRPIGTALSCFKILEFDYGHFNSSAKWSCLDKNNQPIPWYTYPAVEYLKQLDFSDKQIFEYGSGNSSLFWSSRAKKVLSVENNKEWHKKIATQGLENLKLKLIEEKDAYIEAIDDCENWDVIVIDAAYRYECAKKAVEKLAQGGLIILDNSDWYVKTANLLRESNLIQVDMTGFGSINFYTWTTSLFFDRKFDFQPKSANQPEHGTGALKQYAEE